MNPTIEFRQQAAALGAATYHATGADLAGRRTGGFFAGREPGSGHVGDVGDGPGASCADVGRLVKAIRTPEGR